MKSEERKRTGLVVRSIWMWRSGSDEAVPSQLHVAECNEVQRDETRRGNGALLIAEAWCHLR